MNTQSFDVHARTGTALSGYGIGPFLVTLSARDHRTAKHDADELFTEAVVVLPHRTPTAKLERALRSLDKATARRNRHSGNNTGRVSGQKRRTA